MADEKFEINEEVSSFLGLEKVKDLDDFKTKFGTTFIKRDAITDDKEITDKIFGERVGSMAVKVKSQFKKAGVEFAEGELADKKVEEITELGFSKMATNHEAALAEVKSAAGKTDDQALIDLQTKHDKHVVDSKKGLEEMTILKDDLKTKFEDLQTKSTADKSEWQMNSQMSAVDKSVAWAADAEFFKERKEAFGMKFANEHKVTLGEDGNLLIADKEGNKITNPDKAGEFMTFTGQLTKMAGEAKLLKTNPHAGPAPVKKPGAPDPDQKPQAERNINTQWR